MLYLYYVIFFFLILRFTVTLFNFISNPKLTQSPKYFQDFVSVLIPARNEEQDIIRLLQSLKIQEYQNIEVIVLDDSSEDNTHQMVHEFCLTDNRFKIIKGNPLENGWLGKNYACHQLALHAKGTFLMFLDADEEVKDGLINNALYRMYLGKLSLLSLFTNQVMKTNGEKSVIPLMHYLLLNLLPLRLVKLSKMAAFAAASGQFMLFNAADYHQNQWHQSVKSKVVEDVEIMKRIKTNGFRGEALLANGYIFCRMYKNYQECLNGFSKNLLSGFGNSIFGLLIYIFLIIIGPIIIAINLNSQLIYFAVSLIVFSRIMISLLSGQNVILNIIFHILQMLNLLVLAFLSIQKNISKNVVWKGRSIN
jgi:glycosyltransferase involved in cell wall biosynthesis